MEYVLANRIKLRQRMYVCFVFVVCAFLFGCDATAGAYPYSEPSEWISRDPSFILTYTRDSTGYLVSEETLIWNEEEIAVDIGYNADFFCVQPEGSVVFAERLFSGTWYYRNGNLVLSVEEDFIFNNQYAEIVLSPQKN